ncbi:hypothetical protein QYE76_063552 [Lolium multiflorum]|uniref:Integrase zinc-binding domain-containing protein n=1 Tax=Lolium multiflorum TaxID=4521 RepID=A0AAD8S7N0_LOLMU|nr:hypothetical protein QYE76_063552 [Lolium multiflorum]
MLSTYVREFSKLSRYAVEEVNTEDKKKKRFLRGLSPQFKVQLRMMRATEFQELVDAAITLEDDFKQLQEEKRKKAKYEPKRCLEQEESGGIEPEISPELKKEISQAQIQLWEKEAHEGLSALQVADEMNVNLKNEIIMGQLDDPFIVEEMKRIDEGRPSEFHRGEMGSLWFQKRICVPDIAEIKEVILREAHQTPYSIHPGSTKMYMDLKELFWWNNMKREIAQDLNHLEEDNDNPEGADIIGYEEPDLSGGIEGVDYLIVYGTAIMSVPCSDQGFRPVKVKAASLPPGVTAERCWCGRLAKSPPPLCKWFHWIDTEQPDSAWKEVEEKHCRAWATFFGEERQEKARANAKAERERQIQKLRAEQARNREVNQKRMDDEAARRFAEEEVRREAREAKRKRLRERAAEVQAAEERGDKSGK